MKHPLIMSLLMLAVGLYVTGCEENCDFEEAPIVRAVDCGLQSPYQQDSVWIYRDTITGDTFRLQLNEYIDQSFSQADAGVSGNTGCLNHELDLYNFRENLMGIESIQFTDRAIEVRITAEQGISSSFDIPASNDCSTPYSELIDDGTYLQTIQLQNQEFSDVFLFESASESGKVKFILTPSMVYYYSKNLIARMLFRPINS